MRLRVLVALVINFIPLIILFNLINTHSKLLANKEKELQAEFYFCCTTMKKYLLVSLSLFLGSAIFAQDNDRADLLQPIMSVDQYIDKYNSLAVEEMYRSKIPASITLAQGILESGNGNSRIAQEANNHFGIKCKTTWTGKTIYEDDDAPQECFRKYDAAIDSYRDHSDFLKKNVRYAFLFDLEPTDYKSWAHGLKRAGYATNPQYAELLITFIERHKLNRFDEVKIGEEENLELKEKKAEVVKSYGKEFENNGVPGIIAKPNQSFAQIAIDYDIKVYHIYRYNDLTKDAVCKAGDTIYLKSKKAKSDILTHTVQAGQTLYWISQRYAVKLDKLLGRNLMKAGQEPAAGEMIYLKNKREKAPVLADLTAPPPVEATSTPLDSSKADTAYNNEVYENPQQNLETQKTVDRVVQTDIIPDFRENLSFFHTVQKGETLYGIGKKYGIRVDAIQYLNGLNDEVIKVGQRLIINPAIVSADTKEPQSIPGVHLVKQGETLFSISKIYNLRLNDIKATNNLPGDTIYVGQRLVIVPVEPGKEVKSPDSTVKEDYYYQVQKGETLYGLARKFRIPVKQIQELNYPLNDTLKLDQKIRIR